MSEVMRAGKNERPTWNYAERQAVTQNVTQLDILEMLESIRNALEQVRDRLPQRRRKKAVAS